MTTDRSLAAFVAMLVSLLLVAVSPARAGDTAEVNILGFSPDGALFAFEEYGVQDGSGFPYANRFYIATATDTFITGTPIRVRLDDETKTVEDARAEAKTQGQSVIPDAVLAANRGVTAGWNAVTELSADKSRIAVNPRPVFPAIDAPVEFRIEDFALSPPSACEGLGVDIKGYRLIRVAASPGETTELVHEDSSVPGSRGCPLEYSIGGLQTFHPSSGAPVFALMIIMRQFGFEGPDHRWLAVAGRL
jgi:predicted secreted protein